jgi:hypothetical protein
VPERRLRGVVGPAGAVLGAAGFVACLALAYAQMRAVMVDVGGFCASGGPYEIASECDDEQVALLIGGILGMVACWGIFAGFAAWAGWATLWGSLLFWAALFGALGWNFIDLGLDPPDGSGSAWGWIVSGAVFWLMALGGLIPALAMAVGWFRARGRQQPPARDPVVRATVPAVGAPAPPEPRSAAPLPRRLAAPDEGERR